MVRAHSSTPCPDAAELAGFFEGTLSESQRAGTVGHLAECAECRAALGALGQMSASELPVVPRGLTQAAARGPSRQRWRPVAAILGAAASVLLAVSIARQPPEQPGSGIATPAASLPAVLPDDVRTRAAGEAPRLVEPKAEALLSSSTRFEWTPVNGAVQYQLHVLTGDGDIVFDATTTATGIEYAGPGERQGPFYAWVSAHLTDGRRVQSAVVRLGGSAR